MATSGRGSAVFFQPKSQDNFNDVLSQGPLLNKALFFRETVYTLEKVFGKMSTFSKRLIIFWRINLRALTDERRIRILNYAFIGAYSRCLFRVTRISGGGPSLKNYLLGKTANGCWFRCRFRLLENFRVVPTLKYGEFGRKL